MMLRYRKADPLPRVPVPVRLIAPVKPGELVTVRTPTPDAVAPPATFRVPDMLSVPVPLSGGALVNEGAPEATTAPDPDVGLVPLVWVAPDAVTVPVPVALAVPA